jgi:hypothetical protein
MHRIIASLLALPCAPALCVPAAAQQAPASSSASASPASAKPAPAKPLPAKALSAPKLVALTLGIGVQHDSNVSIDDADLNLRKGDDGLLLSAGITLTPLATRRTTLRLGYSYDEIRNRELTDFDLAIHGASASVTRRFGRLTAGLDYQYSHVLLDGERYLAMHMASPSMSAFATPHLFVRGAVTFLRKDFATVAPLRADTTMVGLDAYRFFARRKGYVALSARVDDERTDGPEFAYKAWQASLRGQVPFRLLGASLRARLGYTFQRRDYSDITPSIGEKRRETRSTLTAALDVPLSRTLTLRPAVRYVDRHSNVAVYDYRQTVVSTMLVWKP